MTVQWETVIGLEIHAQLATRSKIFSGAPTAYGAAPNTQACAVDLGLPGVLPVLNREAVRMAATFGLAIDATIAERSVFERKNYFYPDLPKGYQISQFEHPIVKYGTIRIDLPDGSEKIVGVTRAHLEEDAGKSLHDDFHGSSGIDLNRAGTPLLEIVSEPDLRSAVEAVTYMRKVHQLVRYLGICDGNMQEGSFRCDANVSIRKFGAAALGTRTELKNLNSFRFIERAINIEIDRQIEIKERGEDVRQETRLYDSVKDQTFPLRGKEEANDYRYFPDPDLLPVTLEANLLADIAKTLPELPDHRCQRFQTEHNLSPDDARYLTATRQLADYFETAAAAVPDSKKLLANWIMGELAAALNREGLEIDSSPVSSMMLAKLVARIGDATISGKIAKTVFDDMWRNGQEPDQIIADRGLVQMNDASELQKIVDDAIAAHPTQAQQLREGKPKLLGFFVGQIMKRTNGTANPSEVNRLLKERLGVD